MQHAAPFSELCCYFDSTRKLLSRLTHGKIVSNTGNATNHDKNQALTHCEGKPACKPLLRKILMHETMQVMTSDKISGMIKLWQRAGSLGKELLR